MADTLGRVPATAAFFCVQNMCAMTEGTFQNIYMIFTVCYNPLWQALLHDLRF